jgi:hypothetical protein
MRTVIVSEPGWAPLPEQEAQDAPGDKPDPPQAGQGAEKRIVPRCIVAWPVPRQEGQARWPEALFVPRPRQSTQSVRRLSLIFV